jgi:hypothetical protein
MLVNIESKLFAVGSHSARRLISSFRSLAVLGGAFLCILIWNHPASGAPINYGDFMGDTVTYVAVTEAALSFGDTEPLFGAPTVTGDSIDFNPVGFSASATGLGGVDITDANLTFMVVAKPGKAIETIQFAEAGDTTLAGFGTNATYTSVTCDGFLNINAVDGVGISTITKPISLTFTPSGGTYGQGTNGGGGPLFHTLWTGSLLVDLDMILMDNGVPFVGGASKISIDIDNALSATSQAGTSALISKKDFGGISITVNIPEPGTLFLAGFALLALVVGRRSTR